MCTTSGGGTTSRGRGRATRSTRGGRRATASRGRRTRR